ncbi:RNA polymerase sigma factor [Alloacidobacterium sp.]|uniref:RNA polymerase sigma factor n=1 Tax=Alloacidobacterium sp. TaxID=2951999 RepID=UPI002D4B2C17|nr:RNA polymerase sigma factor [Alloacidobacterium sp.]HYK34960.1 RNA polymerase sigma factor [Alloacidobacterium sp.]
MARSNEAEFTAFVQRQSRFVFRVAYAVLRHAHDAEDVVQEVFLKLYRNGAWEKLQNEQAFLARTAWRVAVDRLPNLSSMSEADTEVPSSNPTPEENVVASDWHNKVHRLIDGLPEELRQPLALSSIQELNSGEIATILGIPEGTVRTRIMRARQLLREKLAAMEEKGYAKRL